jgi:hypothetical protein
MTLAYRKGAMNEVHPLRRRPDFVHHATNPLFWDGEVLPDEDLRRKSHPLFEDGQLNVMNVNALRLSHDFAYLIHEGHSQDSFYRHEGEWAKDNWIRSQSWLFWRLDRLCVPRNYGLRLLLITEPHDNSSVGHGGVASTLAKALDRFWWKRIRQDVENICERCVVCRRLNIQPHMAATLYTLRVPPKHKVGLDYLTHLHVSNGFDNVLVVDSWSTI